MRRWPALALLVSGCLIGSASPTGARGDWPPPRPCEAFWRADVVFIGVVRSVDWEWQEAGYGSIHREVATFDVIEVARGPSAPVIGIDARGAVCPDTFEIGESYVVYASNGGDMLHPSDCGRTRPLSKAAEDVAYIRGLPSLDAERRTHAWLTGTVQRLTPEDSNDAESDADRDDREAAGVGRAIGYPVSLTLRSEQTSLVIESRDGRFDAQVPPGGYYVEARAPEGFRGLPSWRFLTLTDARACAVVDVFLRPDGHVLGQVLDADGSPVPGLQMQVAPATAGEDFVSDRRAGTGEDGRFDIGRIEPGTYRVLAAVPGPAVEVAAITRQLSVLVEVGESAREDVGRIRLPRSLDLRPIRGVVVDARGAPVSGANVWLDLQVPADDAIYSYTESDDEGRFILTVPPGRLFVVHAFRDRFRLDERGKTDVFIEHDKSSPVSGGEELRLTLKRAPD